MKSRASFILFHVILPLLVGGMIYACWRDYNLPMFSWFDLAGIGPLVHRLRVTTAPLQVRLPFWFQFSVPDAMWVYALTAFMALVWRGSNSWSRPIWISTGLLLGAGSELGQLAGILPGSFDAADLGLCVCAAILALMFTSRSNFQRSTDDAAT